MFGTVLAFLVLGAAVWLLFKLKQKDVAGCTAMLGLTRAAQRRVTRGRTPEGWDFTDILLATGTIEGLPAELRERGIRGPWLPKTRRSETQFTLLALTPARAPRAALRLQPAGVLRTTEQLVSGAPAIVLTGDAAFDAAYHLYSNDPPAALLAVSADLRGDLMQIYTSSQVGKTKTLANAMTAGLLLGTFDIGSEHAIYYVYGTPTTTVATQLKAIAPILSRLAS